MMAMIAYITRNYLRFASRLSIILSGFIALAALHGYVEGWEATGDVAIAAGAVFVAGLICGAAARLFRIND